MYVPTHFQADDDALVDAAVELFKAQGLSGASGVSVRCAR